MILPELRRRDIVDQLRDAYGVPVGAGFYNDFTPTASLGESPVT